MPNTQRFYYSELDGLRFIAFLLVFIHNASPILSNTFLETFSKYSWFGVDLFFSLSAFLITKLLVTEYEQTGKINIRNFYIRRALRIWPLYFFYIILGTIIIAPVEGRNINIPGHLAGLATFTFNFVYLSLLPSPILIFVHLWSISYEEQFYAVIPWFIRKLTNSTQTVKLTLLVLLFLTGTIIRGSFIYFKLNSTAIYFLPITHFDSMLGGIALGLGVFDQPLNKIHSAVLWVLSIICISAIFLLPNNNATGWGLTLTYLLVGIAMTLIVFLITEGENLIVNKVLGNKMFIYLGKISYGLYIYHIGAAALAVQISLSIFNIAPTQISSYWILLLTMQLALSLLFSVLSYHGVELRFLKLKERFSAVASHST